MREKLQVVVDGTYVSALTPWGDLEWSTVWPGGSEALSFGVARSHRLFRVDAVVELYHDSECLWCGKMLDPTRGEPLFAEGLFRSGEDFGALDAAGDATTSSHLGTVEAIARGLAWAEPPAFATSSPALDVDQPHSVSQLLDHKAITLGGLHWGIDPATRMPFFADWEPASLHLLPGVDGLGISREGYASTLKARYLDSTTGTYKTVTGHDDVAEGRWGYAERMLPEPLSESVSMTAAVAQDMIDGLVAQGAAQIGWTTPLEVQYGDVVNEHMQPEPLYKIAARRTLTLHDLVENVADLAGSTRTDMPIRRVHHKGATSIIEPRGLVSPMDDVLEGKTS